MANTIYSHITVSSSNDHTKPNAHTNTAHVAHAVDYQITNNQAVPEAHHASATYTNTDNTTSYIAMIETDEDGCDYDNEYTTDHEYSGQESDYADYECEY